MHFGDIMKIFYENKNRREFIFLSHDLTFDAHIHEAVEIVYMIEGTAHAFSAAAECNLSPGDFFVVFPNSVHYYDNCSNNLAIVAIIPLEMLSEFRTLLTSKVPVSPLIQGDNTLAEKLFETALLYNGKYKEEALHGLFLSALSVLMEKLTLMEGKDSESNTLSGILEFCESNYLEDISLDTVSKNLGISKSHISHIFSNKIRMNFRSYINSLRLSYAVKLIMEEESNMTKIAEKSGFETIRTFNRAFRKKYGISPLEYRKQKEETF